MKQLIREQHRGGRDRGADQGRARRPVRPRACSRSRRKSGLDLLAWLAAARGSSSRARSASASIAWGWSRGATARRGGRRRPRSTRSSSGESTHELEPGSSSERRRDPGRAARRVPLVPRPVRPAARARATCRRSRRSRPTELGRPGRRAASSSRASRSCSGSPRSSSRSASARRSLGGALFRDQFLLEQISGFVLVVFGLAFMGLLPWPERLVGAGLVQGARSPRLAGAARRRVRGLRRTVHRAGARGDPRARRLVGHGARGRRPARRLLARPRDPVRARRRRLHAR